MRWVTDENVQERLVAALRDAGEDVVTVAGLALSAPDDIIVRLALDEGRLLLTADKDFGELVVRRRRPIPGVVLLRLHGLPLEERSRILLSAIATHAHRFPGSFTVIHPLRVPIMPLPKPDGVA